MFFPFSFNWHSWLDEYFFFNFDDCQFSKRLDYDFDCYCYDCCCVENNVSQSLDIKNQTNPKKNPKYD